MSKTVLFVVESPGKVRKIQAYLGPGYKVVPTVGHILDIGKKGYGFKRDELGADFEPDYRPINAKAIAELRRWAKKCGGGVLIGTDADRTGAAIGFHVLEVLGLDWRTSRRAVFTEITKEALLAAVAAPVPPGSTAPSRRAGSSTGRPATCRRRPCASTCAAGSRPGAASPRRAVVDREALVAGFVAEPRSCPGCAWPAVRGLRALASPAAALPRDERGRGGRGGPGRGGVRRGRRAAGHGVERRPPPAFTTSTLQQAAGRAGLSPKATMALLQGLYQAGHVTYPRTDSVALAPPFVHAAAAVVAAAPWGGEGLVRSVHGRRQGQGRAGRAAGGPRGHPPDAARVEAAAGPGGRLRPDPPPRLRRSAGPRASAR